MGGVDLYDNGFANYRNRCDGEKMVVTIIRKHCGWHNGKLLANGKKIS